MIIKSVPIDTSRNELPTEKFSQNFEVTGKRITSITLVYDKKNQRTRIVGYSKKYFFFYSNAKSIKQVDMAYRLG